MLALTSLFLLCVIYGGDGYRLRQVGYITLPDCSDGSHGMFKDAVHKVAYDPNSKLIYAAGKKCVHIIDVANRQAPVRLHSQTIFGLTVGDITDIQVCGSDVILVMDGPSPGSNGHVAFCSLYDKVDHTFNCPQNRFVTVGYNPSAAKFTSDCQTLLVSNEARPVVSNGFFADLDPSIYIIKIDADNSPIEHALYFNKFDSQAEALRAAGVRYVYKGDHVQNYPNTFSADLEPGAITISDDNTKAYITLHENNAIAVVDIVSETLERIFPLGIKDWRNYRVDLSDRDLAVALTTGKNVRSFYQPKDLGYITMNNKGFLVTANTGGMKQFSKVNNVGVDFVDFTRVRLAFSASLIDNTLFPNGAVDFVEDGSLGRLHISTIEKDCDHGLIHTLYAFGGRDLGLMDISNDSWADTTGDDLEVLANQTYRGVFNGDCSTGTSTPEGEMDSRSDDMGPEPNAIVTGYITGSNIPIAVAATRNGLLYTYTFANNQFVFNSVKRAGTTTGTWDDLYGTPNAGDGLITDLEMTSTIGGLDTLANVIVASSGTGSVNIYDIVTGS